MTADQEKLLAAFENSIQDLMKACDRQKQTIDELRHSLEDKEKELKQAMETIEGLKTKCDSMLTARVVSVQEKEAKSARKRLSNLVREVDKCIALLNE